MQTTTDILLTLGIGLLIAWAGAQYIKLIMSSRGPRVIVKYDSRTDKPRWDIWRKI
jgi:hypothetical protein